MMIELEQKRCNVPYTADLGNYIHRLTSSPTLFHADYRAAAAVPRPLRIANAVPHLLCTTGTVLCPLRPCW
jgi:hypothetical protein